MKTFEENLKYGYEEYLKLPKAKRNKDTDIYLNKWCVITGKSIIPPHPHRHFTFLEFVYFCGQDASLWNRFLNNG